MNYLAHGRRRIGEPWVLAGTALPDWLRVLDRRCRIPAEDAAAHVGDADPRVASLARGVLQHHEDDRRFHGSPEFDRTRREVAAKLRTVLHSGDRHRPWFVAHLVVEVLLDAAVAAAEPGLLDAYYAALASLDPDDVAGAAHALAPRAPPDLARLVRGFVRERFVADYADPERVRLHLDRVLRRVRQPVLPSRIVPVLAAAYPLVASRRAELLGEELNS